VTTDQKSISLRKHLIQSASGSLVIKICQTGLNLLLAVVLARVLGVEGFGVYAFCLSIVQILTVPARLGGPELLVRELSAYQARGQFGLMKGVLTQVYQVTLAVSILLAFLAGGIGYFIYAENSTYLVPFLASCALIPFLSRVQIQGASLRGLRRIIIGQIQEVFRPLFVLICIGFLYWVLGRHMTPSLAVFAQVGSTGIVVILSMLILYRSIPDSVKRTHTEYETSRWIRSALPFMFTGGMQILNRRVSIVFLGIMLGPEAVGIYQVALRGSELIPFGLLAVNASIGPTASQLFAQNEKKRLQRVVNKSVMAILAFSLPVSLILLLGGKWIIPFVFGAEFASAYPILAILCIGQLINAGMGSVGLLLNMAGFEKYTAWGVAIAAVTSIILNFLFIPLLGALGAAIATSISLIIWNISLAIWLYKKTGIVSTICPNLKAM
jgi:O-antigen/teichoic acid export membrane protein